MRHFQPEGWPTTALASFIKAVFLAKGECVEGRPVELRIGDSMLMISDGGGLREHAASFLYIYVEDVDATFERAVALEAICLESPGETPYGDRRATILDKWGNIWQIATHRPI